MKLAKTLLILTLLITMSFTTVSNDQYSVVVEESTIEWKGFKPTGDHFGIIAIKEGSLVVSGKQLITGSFTIDMNSIKVTDSDSPRLEKHLKSDDFFGVKEFSTAKFDISGSQIVDGKTLVKGFLTIKNIRKEISFLANISTNKMGQLVLESDTFKINRADFNVKFKSKTFYANLKDKFINDEFELKVKVVSVK